MARIVVWAAASSQLVNAVSLDTSSHQSILDAAASIAEGIFAEYTNAAAGGAEVGLFPFPPYYWWESGATWGGMADYFSYTGDSTYLQRTLDALAAQVGPNFDYIPPQQTNNEANDDQAFWIFSVLDALEQGLPALPCAGAPNDCSNSYLTMAINVFNEQTARYNANSNTCSGGLLWQYTPSLKGTDYKNTVTNGGLINIAARLAHYTGDSTYADWASKIWSWEESIGLITSDYHVYDGAHTEDNCATPDRTEWTYNNAIHMHGAAMMYDYTSGSDMWRKRVQGLMDTGMKTFFSPFDNATGVLYEPHCELSLACSADSTSFKAYLARFWAKATVLAPFTADTINPLIVASAKGAAASCNGNGANVCGMAWWLGTNDGSDGLGQQLSALEIVQGLLVGEAPLPKVAPGVQRVAPVSVASSTAVTSIDLSTLSDSILTLPGPARTALSVTKGLSASSDSVLTRPGPTHTTTTMTSTPPSNTGAAPVGTAASSLSSSLTATATASNSPAPSALAGATNNAAAMRVCSTVCGHP